MEDEENDSKQPEKNTTKHLLDGAEKWDSKLIHLSKPIIAPSIMNTIIGMQKTLEPLNKIAALSEAANKMGTILGNQTDLAKTMQIGEKANIWRPFVDATKTMNYFQDLAKKTTWNTAIAPESLTYLSAIKSISNNLDFALSYKSPVFYASSPEWLKSNQLYTYATKSVIDITPQNIGSKTDLEKKSRIHLNASFSSLSNAYTELLKTYALNPIQHSEIDLTISKIIPSEYFATANLVESISVDEDVTVEEEVLKTEIIYENEVTLSEYLPKLHPDLYNLWQGAVQAFHSENADKTRHIVTSIRELFTHVIHIMAPDNEIHAWTNDPLQFHEGRPTRKARFHYIFRNINHDGFIDCIKKDIEATLTFMGIFQRGTHQIRANFSDGQLIAFKSKAEGTLKHLLEIHFKINT